MANKVEPRVPVHKYLVILNDEDTGTWTIAQQTSNQVIAAGGHAELMEDGTPSIVIFTGDYLTV